MLGFRSNIARTLPAKEVDVVVGKAINEFIDAMLEGHFKRGEAAASGNATSSGPKSLDATGSPDPSATSASSSSTASIWPTYVFGLGGLQQFLLDLKYFGCSIGGSLPPPQPNVLCFQQH